MVVESMHIRQSRQEDFKQIVCLFRQLWPNKRLNIEELNVIFKSALDSSRDVLLSVEYENHVIAFSSMTLSHSFWQESNIGYITTLIVDEKIRNQGIGKKLMDELIHIAKRHHCKKIELDSAPSRTQAHQFYIKLGFENRAYLFSKNL